MSYVYTVKTNYQVRNFFNLTYNSITEKKYLVTRRWIYSPKTTKKLMKDTEKERIPIFMDQKVNIIKRSVQSKAI